MADSPYYRNLMILSVSCTIIVAMITIMDRLWDPVKQQNNKMDTIIKELREFKEYEREKHRDFDKRVETLERAAWNAHSEYQWFLNDPSRTRGGSENEKK